MKRRDEDEEEEIEDEDGESTEEEAEEGEAPRRPRGRPNKRLEAYQNPLKRKRGRPRGLPKDVTVYEMAQRDKAKSLEVQHVNELSELQVNDHDIALYINKDLDYLKENYRYDVDLHRLKGQVRLLKAQFQKALEGNSNMLVWLGKHYLGQRDDMRVNSIEPEVRMLFSKIERLEYERSELLSKPYYNKQSEDITDIVPKHK